MTRLAVIGLGHRAAAVLSELHKTDASVELVAVADPNLDLARERFAWPGFPPSPNPTTFEEADALLERADDYDGIIVGTPCALHASIAIKVARTGVPLFLEKPVAVTDEQAVELADAFRGRLDSVVVSFPVRLSPLFAMTQEIVASGHLGEINQIQAFNYVSYGGIYFGQWYRDYGLTRGLWLQKATHDFDFLNSLVGAQPARVAAMETRKIYGGDMPEGLRCSACDLVDECMESPKNIELRGDDGGMGYGDHWCAFGREIKHHDAGSALLQYPDGTHASYAQNFVTRRQAARRGAIITGYRATLDFDWYTDTVRIIEHHRDHVETHKARGAGGHRGGDAVLARTFLDVIGGAKSPVSLADGLLSVATCLAADRSTRSGRFEDVPTFDQLESGWLPAVTEQPT